MTTDQELYSKVNLEVYTHFCFTSSRLLCNDVWYIVVWLFKKKY